MYFAPAKSAIERFNNIMSKESFRKNVKELVYDARLFVKDMLEQSKFSRLLRRFFPCPRCESLVEGFQYTKSVSLILTSNR